MVLGEKVYFLEVRDDLIGYLEVKVLSLGKVFGVENFILYDIIFRWGYFLIVVVDGGLEFRKEVVEILERLGVFWVVVLFYNVRVNGVMEFGYILIVLMLVKMMDGMGKKWK